MNSLQRPTTSHVKLGYQGIKEWQPNMRITFINGINATYEKSLAIASTISNYHKYNKVHFVCDETQGKMNDLIDCANLLVLNSESEAVAKLTNLWLSLFSTMNEPNNPNNRILHYAWSRGGIVTKLALKRLPHNLREKMIVYTFGTPAIISSNEANKVVQINNSKDYIPYTNPFRWINMCGVSFKNDKNIKSNSHKLLDHGIVDSTYLPEIIKMGEIYTSTKDFALPNALIKPIELHMEK